jgi:hypothetical protein
MTFALKPFPLVITSAVLYDIVFHPSLTFVGKTHPLSGVLIGAPLGAQYWMQI